MIHIDNTPDIYETINRYDCLITDYSSIYFDFLLTNKPIVFSAFDLEVYKKNERQLYFDFDEVTLNPNCLNWTEVIERVIDLKENDMTDEYKQAYFLLKEKFHGKECDLSESFSKKLFNKLTLIG
jgi:CDP-glycerol glycerophosphotransferase